MPVNNPGSLKDDEYLAVVSYFLTLAALAVRTVFGTSIGKAIGTV